MQALQPGMLGFLWLWLRAVMRRNNAEGKSRRIVRLAEAAVLAASGAHGALSALLHCCIIWKSMDGGTAACLPWAASKLDRSSRRWHLPFHFHFRVYSLHIRNGACDTDP